MADQTQATAYNMIKFEDFFELPLKTYKLIGLNIIPSEITSRRTKVIEKLMKWYFFACFIGIWLMIIQFVIRLVIDINNFHVVVRVLPNITIFPYNCYKGILFMTKRKKILNILDKLRISFPSTQIEQEKCNLQSHLKLFHISYKIYIVCFFASMSSSLSLVFYQLIFYNIRVAAVVIWFPFDFTANNLNFNLSALWLTWTVSNAALTMIAADLYLFANILVLSTEFSIISKDIKNAINEGQVTNLGELFIRHQELISISDDIKSLFTFIFFFIQGAVSISSSGFQLLTATGLADLLSAITYAACPLTQVYLYCFYGEKLITASQDVTRNILESNWYEIKDNAVKKSILFVIMRSQKACMFSGFGSVSLSIETFSNVS